MNTQTQHGTGTASAGSLRHRVYFSPGVIMVPALQPTKRVTQSALERQLELLRMAVSREAEVALRNE